MDVWESDVISVVRIVVGGGRGRWSSILDIKNYTTHTAEADGRYVTAAKCNALLNSHSALFVIGAEMWSGKYDYLMRAELTIYMKFRKFQKIAIILFSTGYFTEHLWGF